MLLIALSLSAGRKNQVGLAQQLHNKGKDFTFWLSGGTSGYSEEFLQSLRAKNWSFVSEDDFNDEAFELPLDDHLRLFVKSELDKRTGAAFQLFFDMYKKKLSQVCAALTSIKPKGIVVSSDGIASDLFLINAARRMEIPILCCPYGFCSLQDLEKELELKVAAKKEFNIEYPGGSIIAAKFPKWVKQGNLSGLLMLKPEVILAYEALGIKISDPWTVYGSESDYFLAPSVKYKNHIESIGFPTSKIKVVGSVASSEVLKVLAGDIEAESAFKKPKRISSKITKVLVSMPPNYHVKRGHFTEFPDSYLELCSAVLSPLAKNKNIELTISFHPATTDSDLREISKLGFDVTTEDINKLIPLNDMYVTDYSSTIQNAIFCGKPVVNYDFYNFDLKAYWDAPGVVKVRTQAAYEDVIRKIVEEDTYFQQLASKQIEKSDHWGTINKNFVEDVYECLELARANLRSRKRVKAISSPFSKLYNRHIKFPIPKDSKMGKAKVKGKS